MSERSDWCRLHIAKVMSDDDVIKIFPVHTLQGPFGRKKSDVRCAQIVGDISSFIDTGYFFEFLNNIGIGLLILPPVGAKKFMIQEIVIGDI